MAYCTQTDIENRYGTTNVAVWSNLDNDNTSANATRIAAAIAYADAVVEDEMRGSEYKLPLTATNGGTPTMITFLAAAIAGWWLFSSRGVRDTEQGREMTAIYQGAIGKLNEYRSGQMTLAASRHKNTPQGPSLVF